MARVSSAEFAAGVLMALASVVLASCVQTGTAPAASSTIDTAGSPEGSIAPSDEAAECHDETNVPGGKDPWGACWPGPGNTGVRKDLPLQILSGDIVIAQPGYVLENAEVRGCISIAANANDVTIRNVLVKADCSVLILNDAGAVGLEVIDSELDGNGFAKSDSAVAGAAFSLDRVDIHAVGDGVKAGSGVAIRDSFIHDLNVKGDSHNDGIQSLDGTGMTIDHNTIVADDGATSCVILSQNSGDGWQMRDVTISRNLLAGGAYTIYGGYQKDKDDPRRASNIVIRDNQISTAIFPNGGAFGPLTSVDPPVVSLVGNLWADGPKRGLPV